MVKTPRQNHWRQDLLHHSKVSIISNKGGSELGQIPHATQTSIHIGTILNDP